MIVRPSGRWAFLAVLGLVVLSAVQLVDALRGGQFVNLPVLLAFTAALGFASGIWAHPLITAFAVGVAAIALTRANQIVAPGDYPVLDDLAFFLIITGGPALAGAAIRQRRRQVRDLRQLTADLAAQHESEKRVARLNERNRIEVELSRDLSEQIAAIVVRARGAQAAPIADQGQAFAEIEDTARSTLDRLRQALGTLADSHMLARSGGPMEPPPVSTREPPPGWKDVGIAAACAVVFAIESVVSPEARGPAWANVIVATLAAMPLVWRRTRPISVAVAMFAMLLVMSRWLTQPSDMVTSFALLVIVSYAVGAYLRRWWRLLGCIVVGSGIVSMYLVSTVGPDSSTGIPPALAFAALACVLGAVTAGFAARRDQLRRALDQLDAGRGAQLELAVAEQRSAIARDLHDSVAHAMTIVCLQAQSGRATGDPAALDTILTSSQRGLRELRGGLDALGAAASIDPAELAAEARQAGLDSEVHVVGDTATLPMSALHLVRRVLREAIVNAGRYAPGARVTVSVDANQPVVRLEVVDDGPVAVAQWHGGAGAGLTGLAADVAATGGTLEWGPSATGGFRVAAQVPR